MASMPSFSAMRATSTAFRWWSSQPPRILMVNGTWMALRMVRKITAAPRGSRISAAPCPLATILATGQPMLRSMPSAPPASRRRAASARTSGSAPSSCWAMGCSSGRWRARARVSALSLTRARASISSLVRNPAPHSRATSRKGALLTPAMGASRRSMAEDGSDGGESAVMKPIVHDAEAGSIDESDGPHGRAVGALDPKGQGHEATAGDADGVQVGEVLDDRDAGREEHEVRGVLLAGHPALGLEDPGADVVVGGIVVADRLHCALDEPLAGRRVRVRRLPPEILRLDAHPAGPVRAQQRDVTGADVLGVPGQLVAGDLGVLAEMAEVDH